MRKLYAFLAASLVIVTTGVGVTLIVNGAYDWDKGSMWPFYICLICGIGCAEMAISVYRWMRRS